MRRASPVGALHPGPEVAGFYAQEWIKFETTGLEVLTAGLGNRQLALSALLDSGKREDVEPSQVRFFVTGTDGATTDGLLISSEGLLSGVKPGEYKLIAIVAGKTAVLPVSVRNAF